LRNHVVVDLRRALKTQRVERYPAAICPRCSGDGALNYAEVRGFLSAVSPLELSEFDAVCGDEDAFKLSVWAHQLPSDLVGNLTFEGAGPTAGAGGWGRGAIGEPSMPAST
jgi:hypothetical protein